MINNRISNTDTDKRDVFSTNAYVYGIRGPPYKQYNTIGGQFVWDLDNKHLYIHEGNNSWQLINNNIPPDINR
mgnify:FL=1